MNNKLYYSPEALKDLNDIQEYITVELCNSSAALNVINKILDMIDKLKDYPNMGAKLSGITDIESDYHFVISGKYIAFYRHVENNVYIDRVLYGRRNYLNIIFSDCLNQKD